MAKVTFAADGSKDYLTFADAFAAIFAGTDKQNIIECYDKFLNTNGVILEGQRADTSYFACEVVTLVETIWDGEGVSLYPFRAKRFKGFQNGEPELYLTFKGFVFQNFTQFAVSVGYRNPSFDENQIELNKCIVRGHVATERCNRVRFIDTEFHNSNFIYTDNGIGNNLTYGWIQNCQFHNCDDIRGVTDFDLDDYQEGRFSNNYFDNCNIGFMNGNFADVFINLNKFNNCSFKSYGSQLTNVQIVALSYTAASDLISLNNITTPLEFEGTQALFGSITYDAFFFPTSETDSQVNGEHIGANPYSISASVANDQYAVIQGTAQKTGNYLELVTIGTSATINFTFSEFVEARFVDHIKVQFELDAGAGEFFAGINEFSWSYSGEALGSGLIPFTSGIIDLGSDKYGYDVLGKLTKRCFDCRVTFQSSTTVGKLRILGVVLVLKSRGSFLPENRTVESIDQPSNVWIASGYDIERPESVKDAFSVPSKVEYTQAEIIAEAALPGSIIQIKYESDDPTPPIEIEGIIINDIQVKKIDTFGDE